MYTATKESMTSIPWATMWARIYALIQKYGPDAVAEIEAYLSTLGLPAWIIPMIDGVILFLWGLIIPPTPVPPPAPAKLNVAKCGCV